MDNGTDSKPKKTKENSSTYAEKRREEKRQALREYLLGHTYLRDIHADLARDDISEVELPVIKFKTETRMKLLAKILPDLKSQDLHIEGQISLADCLRSLEAKDR